ncbi:MAG: SulP family inorganic anion transporter [Flavobacteriaceae bacterium]|nr:SulP family inorganic anion transporter [Flavobacteriaceae bacterium]
MTELFKKIAPNSKDDFFAGITVSLAMIPEVVAFAFVANIDPLVALTGAFIVGLITAVFGGRPGLISGAAGAVAVIFVNMIQQGHVKGLEMEIPVENMGYYYLLGTVILMGLIQVVAGIFKLGKFIRLIPHSVMMGFVNGLAIVIFIAQLGMFTKNEKDFYGNNKINTQATEQAYFIKDNTAFDYKTKSPIYKVYQEKLLNLNTGMIDFEIHDGQVFKFDDKSVLFEISENKIYNIKQKGTASILLENERLLPMAGLVLLTMLIIFFLPKLTKKIPSALTAILVITILVIFFGIDVPTVGSYIIEGGGKGLKGHFPTPNSELWSLLPFNMETLAFIFPYAFLAASVGLIETLMTMSLVDDITETRGNGNKESIAQGAGNIVSGLFGGTAGCGMIGQTMINMNSRGRGRFSGIVTALTLLSFILFADQYIEQVPIAALVGVMFMMVIETFAWSSFRIIRKIPISDAVVLILVSVITVIFDLAIAVFIGVIISALVFSWQNAKRIRARKRVKEDGTKVYEIWGPLFFGSISAFNEKFDVKNDPSKIEIDFIESRVSDHSGLEAINNIVDKYKKQNKTVHLTHLSSECKELLYKADPDFINIIIEDIDDPRYHIVANPESFN